MTIELMRLSRRILSFYDSFNRKDWEACFDLLDPKLREERVKPEAYVASLSSFFDEYGPVAIESIERLQPYMHVKGNQYDDRPFAFGVIRWQDRKHRHHVFRERWVKWRATWYTRKIGLV
jgi:hypothetical protein